jgi:hypothetical protein
LFDSESFVFHGKSPFLGIRFCRKLTFRVVQKYRGRSHNQNEIIALRLSPMMFGMLLLPFAGKIRRSAGKRGPFALLLLLALLVTSLAALSGCATKNSGYLGNANTNYTLTVTGASGALSRSTTVTLTVQ